MCPKRSELTSASASRRRSYWRSRTPAKHPPAQLGRPSPRGKTSLRHRARWPLVAVASASGICGAPRRSSDAVARQPTSFVVRVPLRFLFYFPPLVTPVIFCHTTIHALSSFREPGCAPAHRSYPAVLQLSSRRPGGQPADIDRLLIYCVLPPILYPPPVLSLPLFPCCKHLLRTLLWPSNSRPRSALRRPSASLLPFSSPRLLV